MADTEEKKKEDKAQATAVNVASLSVPTIIAALHQNALAHSDATSKGARLTNSAIEDDGGKAKITSAGEHIISVIPIDEKKPIEKKVAIEILKNYVQWFVGPDLASKVNSSTVKSLTEAPGNASTSNEEKKGTDKFSTDEDLSESHHFMSFKQFLREAGEDEKKDGFSSDSDLDDGEESKAEDKKEDDKKDGFTGDDDLEDKKEDPNIGYYVPYSLKVEGLPQTALKDAMKKFASTFFDDVKITASGLFGGGDSFTVKDIKDTLRDAFGPIDPDDLVKNVKDRIDKLYKGTNEPSVTVQEKNTLIADLGNQITGPQKKQINTANYSLFIQIDETDPKKPIFTPRVVADIVTSSIKGLFKKFKHAITKNDVIFIPGYKDIHKNPQKIRALYAKVPIPDDIRKAIAKDDASKAHSAIENLLNKIQNDPEKNNCDRALECSKAWETFKKERDSKGDTPEKRQSIVDQNEIKKYFASFIKAYDEAYKRTQDKTIDNVMNESTTHKLSYAFIMNHVRQAVLNSILNEDAKIDKPTENITANAIREAIVKKFKAFDELKAYSENGCVTVNQKEAIEQKLKNYVYDKSVFGNFKNAVLACKNVDTLSESTTLNSIKSSIMNILFEKDDNSSKDNEKPNDIAKKMFSAYSQLFINDFKIKNFADQVYVLKLQQLGESTKANAQKFAYLFPFGDLDVVPPTDNNVDDASTDSNDSNDTFGKYDAYVIPMPGLKIEDPEYANTNI